ncbi:MAG TPA: hypothetical protein DET40_12010 [Lentisphaeria bacterium]|nr:MAG: hypothetical protein A2X45_16755 [Lentisphaerae bacterium GWF2_50_93]HCE44264.1 hypothetical protein [Lentisphaeria bacterium]
MRKNISLFLFLSAIGCFSQDMEIDPAKINAYVTPFYNSAGPEADIGKYSKGLVSKTEETFLKTIKEMKQNWQKLSVEELFVGAICLYDHAYRDESVYWFYTAQLRARALNAGMDQSKAGGVGSTAFEILSVQNSFYQLTGPYINGYAFRDTNKLAETLKRVKSDGIPNLQLIYTQIAFIPDKEREAAYKQVLDGMNGFIEYLQKEKESIKKQRIDSGASKQFDSLENKELPSIPRGHTPAIDN